MEEHISKSGAYFVAGELERRGFITTISKESKGCYDFTVTSDTHPHKEYDIIVKIQTGIFNIWKVDDFDRKNKNEKKFYIFCKINYLGSPEYFIVPGKKIMEQLKDDSSMSRFQLYESSPYLNAWSLLER